MILVFYRSPCRKPGVCDNLDVIHQVCLGPLAVGWSGLASLSGVSCLWATLFSVSLPSLSLLCCDVGIRVTTHMILPTEWTVQFVLLCFLEIGHWQKSRGRSDVSFQQASRNQHVYQRPCPSP